MNKKRRTVVRAPEGSGHAWRAVSTVSWRCGGRHTECACYLVTRTGDCCLVTRTGDCCLVPRSGDCCLVPRRGDCRLAVRVASLLGVAWLMFAFTGGIAARAAEREEGGGISITRPILFDTPEADEILQSLQVFPSNNPWNQDVSERPVHRNSRNLINSIGADKPLRHNSDMGFILVPPRQRKIKVKIVAYPDESDKGPFPVPDNVPIEGWPVGYQGKDVSLDDVQRDRLREDGDRHAIIVDPVNRMLYELYQAKKTDAGWQAAQTSIFNLKSNKLRPDGWTSADAAGLPIFPAVVRYDELKRGMVEHAMRVTVRRTRRAYVSPATHFASRSNDPNLPRMGERLRLKRDYPIDGFSPNVQAILKGLKKYGMFVADNGIDWAISVAPDPRIPPMHEELRRIKGSAFEVVDTERNANSR